MKRYTDKTRFVPGPEPVKHIEISGEHIKLKTVIFIIAVAIAIIAFAQFVIALLGRDPGWKQIEIRNDSEAGVYSKEFVLNYYVAESGSAYKAEVVSLESIYTESLESAKRLYDLGSLNASPNESVNVSSELYAALHKLSEAGDRKIFLAPVYDLYRQIFFSQSDAEAMKFDPYKSKEAAGVLEELKRFFADPSQVDLVFEEDGRVMLKVSQEYLSYAKEHGIDRFLDLYWMENALIVDYISGRMIDAGYYEGKLASYDGYSRYFSREEGYAQVIMMNAPRLNLDMNYFYVYGDGTVRHGVLDETTGLELKIPDDYGKKAEGNGNSCFGILLELCSGLSQVNR